MKKEGSYVEERGFAAARRLNRDNQLGQQNLNERIQGTKGR